MPQYVYYQWKQYPVPIQYSLPKWINAAEAGVIIDWSADVDDLLSLVFERQDNWIIKTDNMWDHIKFTKLRELPDTAKPYERMLFSELLSNQNININEIRFSVLDYCVKMWWVEDPFWYHEDKRANIFWIVILIPFTIFAFMTIIWIPIWIFFIICIISLCKNPAYAANSYTFSYNKNWKEISAKSFTKLTEKWKLLQSHLLWYKQYLKQVKITTKTDIIDDGTLSNRIPLKVNNWGIIIDSIKKYKINKDEYSYDALFEKKLNEWTQAFKAKLMEDLKKKKEN